MKSNRKIARIVGVLLIACTAATIISLSLTDPILTDPDYLTKLGKNENLILLAIFFEFIMAITCAGIAIWLYPILKKYNEVWALGSVGFRIVESVFVLVGTLSLLSLLTLSQEFVKLGGLDTSSYQASGALLLTTRDWAHNVILLIAFNLGALLYYYLFYQSKLVPRWLSGWGIAGNVFSLIAIAYYTSTHDLGLTHTLMNAPIALQEMVLAVWLIAKGFNSSAIAPRSVKPKKAK
jgi:hypothetical protein